MTLINKFLAIAALLALSAALSAAERPERPNVLLILADDVGQEPLGCYGGESCRTPNLDRLAAGGIKFQYAHAMPVCHPTRVCLLTGRYPFRLGNPGWGTFPKEAEGETFAHALKAAGYTTAIAGKWQLTLLKNDPRHPHRLGFDQSCLFGWHEGARYHDPYIWQNGELLGTLKDRYGPDVYTDFLIDFMKKSQADGKPFVAFYSMALCHNVTDDIKEPVPYGPQGRYMNYVEMAESMDEQVGKLVAALDSLGLREKTLILFTGDNGTSKSVIISADENGKPVHEPITLVQDGKQVRGGKGELTDAGTRVPLIANWPGTVKPGQVADDLVDMSDYFATLLDLGGAAAPREVKIDGRSFAPRLFDEGGKSRPWVFAEGKGKHWVRTQRWKLYSDGPLFDAENDPQEKKPLAEPPTEEGRADFQLLKRALDGLQSP